VLALPLCYLYCAHALTMCRGVAGGRRSPQGVALGVLSKLTLYKMGSPQQQNAQSHSNHKLRQRVGPHPCGAATSNPDLSGFRLLRDTLAPRAQL
jgi:hypothetical protein